MTSPERIEELLNEFGETLTDLPIAEEYRDFGYRDKLLKAMYDAGDRAKAWFEVYGLRDIYNEAPLAFICHQSGVIEKLIKALETSKGMWDNLKGEVQNLMVKTPLCEDHYNSGYNGACMDVLEVMREISDEDVSKIINR